VTRQESREGFASALQVKDYSVPGWMAWEVLPFLVSGTEV
jgi:hypothetical protein